MPLFRGESAGNVQLGSWGSGKAESTKESVLFGDASIKVTTQGLYQGARLDFRNPVDLSAALRNPRTYLRMQVRFTGTSGTQQVFDPFSTETTRAASSPFERMRFLVTMGDGKTYEMVRPIDLPPSEDPESYVPLSFPIAAIMKKAGESGVTAVPTGTGAQLRQLAIFGDKYQQFFIGEIGIITDETEIVVTPLEDQIIFKGDRIRFEGSAEGGATSLKYSWDFDARDGIQEDATGRIVSRAWTTPGKYTITLTVSDVDGLKKPGRVSQEIEVSE